MDYRERPATINHHVVKFHSHPATNALRDQIAELQALYNHHKPYDPQPLNIFLGKTLKHTLNILAALSARLGVRVGVNDSDFSPRRL